MAEQLNFDLFPATSAESEQAMRYLQAGFCTQESFGLADRQQPARPDWPARPARVAKAVFALNKR